MLFLTGEIILKCRISMGCIVSANALFFLNGLGCLKIKNEKEENKETKQKKGARGNRMKGKGEKTSLP